MARQAAPSVARRTAVAAGVASTLVAAVLGGLLRTGVGWPDASLVLNAAVAHAALMMSGFLGTVISIERAVALKQGWAFAVPLCTLAGSAFILAGQHLPGAFLYLIASALFAGVNVVIVRRQAAAHTALLLVAALAWLAGNAMLASGLAGDAVHAWWFSFLVITIAAERLEMTRLMRRRPAAQHALLAVIASLIAGAALSAVQPQLGGLVFGAALLALAAWLGLYDIARRTALAHGLSRYMAVCLLSGYVWLAAGGIGWMAMQLGAPTRDLALHALGLGFVVSMVMGHAPAILPAVARVKLHYGAWFYLPLVLLHASLLVRLAGGYFDPTWRSAGTVFNALALVAFAITLAASAIAWRMRHAGRTLIPRTRP